MAQRSTSAPVALASRVPVTSSALRTGAGAAAAVAVWTMTLLRVAINAPIDPSTDLVRAAGGAEHVALAAAGLAALAIGATTDAPLERVGLTSVGVFGLLTVVAPAATVPAAGAVTAGGCLAAVAHLPQTVEYSSVRRWFVAAVILSAVALSLAGVTGTAPGVRSLASALALFGVALTPVFASPRVVAWFAGGLAALAVLGVGTAAPFATGAVVLVGWAVVGAPLALVAAAAGGGTTALAAGLRARTPGVAVGATLLLGAGVPASVPRAVAAVLGITALVATWGDSS